MPYRSDGYLLDYVGSFLRLRILSKEDKRKYDFICLGENAGSTLPFFSMWKKVSATCIDKVHVHSKPWIFTWGAHGVWMTCLALEFPCRSCRSGLSAKARLSQVAPLALGPHQNNGNGFHRVQSASAQHDVAHIVTGLYCIVLNSFFVVFCVCMRFCICIRVCLCVAVCICFCVFWGGCMCMCI